MEKRIRQRFTSDILHQALALFDIKLEQSRELDGFESFIYQFDRGDQKGILRISHSIRRSEGLIQAELDWINHLHQGGVRVARPIQSIHGEWLEIIEDGAGGAFLTAAFDWAPGKIHRGEWPKPLLREYGTQLGRMHRLAVDYRPPDPTIKRAEWHDPRNLDFSQFLPEKDVKIKQISQDLLEYLHTLPKPSDGYGMIHQDPHPGNFHVDVNHKITFFDFDDCAYGWFVNDIALVLFYTAMGKEEPADFIQDFLDEFLVGYYGEFDLDPIWFKQIPVFQKLRELDLYALIHRSFDVENLDDPWVSWYMDGRAEKLEEGRPFLNFDFEGFDFNSYR
jgi:Ser/Thr protein kinase RdoA (MazF antagonist)